MNSGEGLIGDRAAPTGLELAIGTRSQGFTLGYFRASLREEGRWLNGGEPGSEPVLPTICVHAIALGRLTDRSHGVAGR